MKIIVKSFYLKPVLNKFSNLKYKKVNLIDRAAEELQESLLITANTEATAVLKICNAYEMIQMEEKIPANVMEPGTIIIPKELISVMESIEEPEIIIADNEIKYGENSIQYVGEKCSNFIQIHNRNCSNELFDVPENELYKLIKDTSYCMSKEELRPVLTGLNFRENKVCGINGFTLAISETDKFNIDTSITLPGNLAKLLLKILDKRSSKMVQVYTDDGMKNIKIIIGDFIINSELLTDEFLNYKQIIPDLDEEPLQIKLDSKKLLSIIKSVSSGIAIKFTITDNKLTVKETTKISKIEKTMPIKIIKNELPDKAFQIASNPMYWKEPLKKYKNKELNISFSTSVGPIILKDGNDTDLILPIRMEED